MEDEKSPGFREAEYGSMDEAAPMSIPGSSHEAISEAADDSQPGPSMIEPEYKDAPMSMETTVYFPFFFLPAQSYFHT